MLDIENYLVELPTREFATGDLLLEQGKHSGQVYVLMEGTVEVIRDGEPIVAISEPGAPLGEISALLQVPHQASVKARTDVRVSVIEAIESLVRTEPQIILELTQTLAERLVATNRILTAGRREFGRLLEPDEGDSSETRAVKEELHASWEALGKRMREHLGGIGHDED